MTTQKRSQSELETILRQGKYSSQSEANSYLQRYGLTCQMKPDGVTEIYDEANEGAKIATIRHQGSAPDQRDISGIDY